MLSKAVAVVALFLPMTSLLSQSSAAPKSSADVPSTLTLQKRATIGGSADANFTPTVLFAGNVATDARGRLYVLDRDQNLVRIYDASGKQISTVGHKGKGPGEFAEPGELGVGADGSIVVSDNAKRAFVRFDASGKVLPEQSMKGLGVLQRILPVSPTTLILNATVRDTAVIMRLTGATIERLEILPPLPTKPIQAWGVCGLRGSSQEPLLSATLIAGANQKLTVTNLTSTFSLSAYELGKTPTILKRNRQPDRLTLVAAREILGDSQEVYIGSNSRRCAIATDAVAKEAGLAPVQRTYERVIVDESSTIWALRATSKNKPHVIDIYTLTSGYKSTATIGGVNPVAFLSDGSVISLETDADDAPVVAIYSVKR